MYHSIFGVKVGLSENFLGALLFYTPLFYGRFGGFIGTFLSDNDFLSLVDIYTALCRG